MVDVYMIRHFQKNCKKKNYPTLREKIIALVAKHSRYPHGLYNACARDTHLSRSEFRDLLDEMDRDGDIHINADNLVLLPEPPPETKPSPPEPAAPTGEIENRTEPASMTADEILEHCRQRAQTKAGDCLFPVERDAHIGNRSRGIYQISHSGNKKVRTSDFERAGFSLMPTKSDGHPAVKYRKYWNTRRKARDWGHYVWRDAYGIKIFTGEASRKEIDGTTYYPICWDIEEGLLIEHPDIFEKIVHWAVAIPNASLLVSKSGGLRINAWVPFVRDKKEQMVSRREWRDPNDPETTKGTTYAEIISGKGLARIDERYLLAKGRIDEFPVYSEEKFMEPFAWLKPLDDRIQKRSATAEAIPDRIQKRSAMAEAIPALDERLPDGLSWRPGDKFLISIQRYDCKHNHKSNPTCEYRKHDNGTITKWCWACNTSWKVVEGNKRTNTAPITSSDRRGIEPVTVLPLDHSILTSAPPIEVRETPSFRHFSAEERAVVSNVLSLDPDAGWHGQTPVFTPKYEYLYPLTQKFALNGQPSAVEKRRVWNTQFGNCEVCGAITAQWVDRYLLTAGLYCDGCHKDYHLGSYLELELNRKLPNSIVSNHQGFLGDDPEFADFRLWQPGIMTHLGAAMSTGKTTEIDKLMIALAIQGLGKGIIAEPLVSFARFLAHYLRRRDGYRSWGLWHEGCHKADKFIGDIGAIVCLPSLPQAVKSANDGGVQRLYTAIDEVDFCYNLLSVSLEQARAVKKCLRDALNTTGLVVSGQTESTLSLEALAEELGCEQVQGFYNTAKPAVGNMVLNKYSNTEGRSNAIVCGTIDDIYDLLAAGHNVYVFCSTRRDCDVIADIFKSENPVIYNAYTKGDVRADEFLRNQQVTDTRLFIGTAAAGVGISILDPKAQTVIASSLIYGSRDANMLAQKGFRDRGRRGGSYHYAEYALPLPVRPTENESVSIYHEALKTAAARDEQQTTASIRKIAHAQALASLADTQIEAFLKHHLQTVGNMPVYHASALACEPERITVIAKRRSEIIRAENEKRITTAVDYLQQRDILTSSAIRKLSNKGTLSKEMRLAHETANAAAQAVGWDEKTELTRDVDNDDLNIAMTLAAENINTEKLAKQRRGYLAVKFPDWTTHEFQSELEKSDSQLRLDGLGIEITAIDDDRFRGKLLTALLKQLIGTPFDSASLATVVREVLASDSSTGKTFGAEIASGALGASAYRRARFLRTAGDDGVVDWVRAFISEWYPARISKNEDTYALCHAKNADLCLASFSRWLMHQPSVPDGVKIDLDLFEPTEPPDPNADHKAEARQRRKDGALLSQIAEEFDVPLSTAGVWCQGITPKKETSDSGSVKDIIEQGGVPKSTAYRRTEKQRADAKAKDIEIVCKLEDQGLSIRKIVDKTGFSKGKVEGILKKHKVS